MNKQERRTRWTRRQLERVQLQVGGEIRTSQRGVPHLVFPFAGGEASVAWFCTTRVYRLFFPWPSGGATQERHDFRLAQDVGRFVEAA